MSFIPIVLQFWILVTEVKVGLWQTLLSLKYFVLNKANTGIILLILVNSRNILFKGFWISWNLSCQNCFKVARSKGFSQPKFASTSKCTKSLSFFSVKTIPRHVELIIFFTQIRPYIWLQGIQKLESRLKKKNASTLRNFKGVFCFVFENLWLCLSLIYQILSESKGRGIIYGCMDCLKLSLLGYAKTISFIL